MNNGICQELHAAIGRNLYQKYADMYPKIGQNTKVIHVNIEHEYASYYSLTWRGDVPLSFMFIGSDRGIWNEEAKTMDFVDDTKFALCYVGHIDTVFINDYYTYRWADQNGS